MELNNSLREITLVDLYNYEHFKVTVHDAITYILYYLKL